MVKINQVWTYNWVNSGFKSEENQENKTQWSYDAIDSSNGLNSPSIVLYKSFNSPLMVLYKFLNSPSIVLLQYFNSFSVIDKIVDIDTILVLLNLNTMITNQLTNRPGSRDAIASKKYVTHLTIFVWVLERPLHWRNACDIFFFLNLLLAGCVIDNRD